MALTKEQFLEQSNIQDRLFSAPVSHRPGEPCDHPGCASHLSHPCEGCGRYAAGSQNGPDVDHAMRYIQNLKADSELIHKALLIAFRDRWSWEQVLTYIVIEQNKINKILTDSLIQIKQESSGFNA
jgi:hypothetical protein